jgi:hypothetical protein
MIGGKRGVILMRLFLRMLLALVLLMPVLVWSPTTAAAQKENDDLPVIDFLPEIMLPDLQTLPIVDLTLRFNPNTGARFLRFSNSIVNAGAGPLELHGVLDKQQNAVIVSQHISSGEEVIVEPLEGTFYFSGDHLHWHWEDFIAYEIWTVETGGELSRKVLSNDKVGFCLYDKHPIGIDWIAQNTSLGLERAPRSVYTTCRYGRQGISVGWVDVYEYHLPGQALDISDLDDGIYALRSVANLYGTLHERNYENNDTVLYFSITGTDLMILGEEFSLMDYISRLVEQGKVDW